MNIESVEKIDHHYLINVWEASVRATHDFLKEEDLLALRPLIFEQYFNAVHLTCVRNSTGEILGFCGVLDGNIEMLFVSPAARGKGVGAALTRHAIATQGVTNVDVNEQNTQALGFYQRMGFAVTGRSPLDGQGKPYPLLHMQLIHR
ncbi:acetyltransferase [Cellvibrio mixtus]|uniref:acetyltransferase n=1 Tax=Cellvibrio mixtus TaxID=39650 RepID=UPI000587FEFB|nr:acetyltransferase [Cellvibrio mixtus]